MAEGPYRELSPRLEDQRRMPKPGETIVRASETSTVQWYPVFAVREREIQVWATGKPNPGPWEPWADWLEQGWTVGDVAEKRPTLNPDWLEARGVEHGIAMERARARQVDEVLSLAAGSTEAELRAEIDRLKQKHHTQYHTRPNEPGDVEFRPWHSPHCYETISHRDPSKCVCGLTKLEKQARLGESTTRLLATLKTRFGQLATCVMDAALLDQIDDAIRRFNG